MIRLLFIPVFTFALFSCEDSSNELEPFFYQISDTDSARCMNEILEGILEEANTQQNTHYDFYNPGITYCGKIEVFRVNVNSAGQMMIDLELDSIDLSDKTFQYFMFNRNLTSEETSKFSVDVNYAGFDFPFYIDFNRYYIQRNVVLSMEEWELVKDHKATDSSILVLYASDRDHWIDLERALTTIQTKSVTQISPSAHIRFEYEKESKKSEQILIDLALAFYQMRNYECMRYFSETYLSLYERSLRQSLKLDFEKLHALKMLHPASIYVFGHGESRYIEILKEEPTP